jgi:hypothetical protein
MSDDNKMLVGLALVMGVFVTIVVLGTRADARRLRNRCDAGRRSGGDPSASPAARRAEAERIERANLGYYAGYYSTATRERVERLFSCAHPIFGAIASAGAPTPAEALLSGAVAAATSFNTSARITRMARASRRGPGERP